MALTQEAQCFIRQLYNNITHNQIKEWEIIARALFSGVQRTVQEMFTVLKVGSVPLPSMALTNR